MSKIVGLLIMTIAMCATFAFCAVNKLTQKTITNESEVEVMPNTFLTYKEHIVLWELEDESFGGVHTKENEKKKYYQQDTTYLSIPWNKKDIRWVGVGVPISIRTWKDKLYMIVFDRDSDFSKIRFRFYKEDHNVLAEITAKDYPKEIATQNLWLSTNNGIRNDKTVVNEVEIAKSLDPDDWDFRQSLTAKIWYQLATDKEYYEITSPIEKDFLADFLKQHSVQKLNIIQRTKTSSSTTRPTSSSAK